MARLYRCRSSRIEIEALFDCTLPAELPWRPMHWPGEKALIMVDAGGERRGEALQWGMPDDLSNAGLRWSERDVRGRFGFHEREPSPRRCVIPMDSFALPAGDAGARTRTWFGLWDEPIFACAGLICWYGVGRRGFVVATTSANELVRTASSAMPVILHAEDFQLWLSGSIDDAIRLWRRPIPDGAMWMERSNEPWA